MNYDAEVERVWNSMPLYIGYKEIESLGFKRTRIYDWFHRPDFPPMIKKGSKVVNKFKFRKWLDESEETENEI